MTNIIKKITFMFQKSPSLSVLLLVAILVTFVFFLSVGSTHIVISLPKWAEDYRSSSTHAVCSIS